jgi:hypothetical protein
MAQYLQIQRHGTLYQTRTTNSRGFRMLSGREPNPVQKSAPLRCKRTQDACMIFRLSHFAQPRRLTSASRRLYEVDFGGLP